MATAILCIGTELVRGEIENTNASWLCRELGARGVEVAVVETIGDDIDRIGACLNRLGEGHDFIIVTGGLGPTTDDLTAEAVANALGVTLQRDAESERQLRERYRSRGVAFGESNAKQADFPQGATVLPNDWGTAPGFSVRIGKALSFFLPGVPREMQPMFERYIVDRLRAEAKTWTAQVRLRTFGAPESKVNDLLSGVESAFGVHIGYRAHFPEIDVKPTATRDEEAEAVRVARAAATEIRSRLGSLVYAEGDLDLPRATGEVLRVRGLTLGVAESCTGGLISSLVAEESCSDYYRGAIVSYANDVKVGVLGVDTDALLRDGAVSQIVVEQMAEGARRVLGCDVALSVSGIAGPSGGSDEKPVGLVYFGLATAERTITKHAVFNGDRQRVQRWAAFVGLNMIRVELGTG